MLFLNISNTSSKCLVFSHAKVLSSCINSGIKVNSCLHFSLFPGAADHNVSDGKGSRTSSNVLPFRSIPGPPCLPLLGSLLPYKLGIKKLDYYHEYLRGLYEKYGPVVREDLGPTTIVHIFDPMDIDKIYKSTTVPHIAPLLQTAKEYKMKKGASQGIGNTNGAEWERLRKAVNKFTLRPQFVNRYIPVQDDVAREAVSLLHKRLLKDDGSVPLLEQLLDRVVTESLHRIVLGSGLGSLDPQRQSADDLAITLAFSNKRIFELSTHLKLSTGLYRKFPTLKSKKLWQLNDLLYGTLHELCSAAAFAKGAAAVSGDEEQARDDSLMHHMMHDNALDGKDYVTIISSFLTDAYVTTVPSLLGALHLLAVSPDVQEQLRHEALSVCPRQERLTHTHVAAATKLAAFFKESLRIYPIGDSVQRLVTEDMVIKNYLLPAG
ncbi:Cytochrome P450 CYP3219A1, partial [Hyalella azteca]